MCLITQDFDNPTLKDRTLSMIQCSLECDFTKFIYHSLEKFADLPLTEELFQPVVPLSFAQCGGSLLAFVTVENKLHGQSWRARRVVSHYVFSPGITSIWKSCLISNQSWKSRI